MSQLPHFGHNVNSIAIMSTHTHIHTLHVMYALCTHACTYKCIHKSTTHVLAHMNTQTHTFAYTIVYV